MGAFVPAAIGSAITPDLRRLFSQPTVLVRTTSGQITFMQCSESPSEAEARIVSWPLREDREVDSVAAGDQDLGKWLASRPEGFSDERVDRAAIAAQHAQARPILSVVPDQISIVFGRIEIAIASMDGSCGLRCKRLGCGEVMGTRFTGTIQLEGSRSTAEVSEPFQAVATIWQTSRLKSILRAGKTGIDDDHFSEAFGMT